MNADIVGALLPLGLSYVYTVWKRGLRKKTSLGTGFGKLFSIYEHY